MNKIISFAKKEAVLVIAALFALISMIFIPPNIRYFTYIDYPVLAILFCLMIVVAGLKKLGIFDFLSLKLLTRAKNMKYLYVLLVNCVFVCAMFITNDVALIVFVPLTIKVFSFIKQKSLIFIIVMETVAANLGSILTPIGNPQNLYIYSFYQMDILQFFRYVLPAGAVSYIIIMGIMIVSKTEKIDIPFEQKFNMGRFSFGAVKVLLIYYGLMFVLCIMMVLHILDYRICTVVVLAATAIIDRKVFKNVDYGLLLTFICFFVFVGNLGEIGVIRNALSLFLEGRVFLVSVATSQIISNVPAAMMISEFTKDVKNLLLGVNIGGLGTPVASLASLISFRLYSRSTNSLPGKYIAAFSVYNISILAVLIAAFYLFL
ncbi:MAG: SLC13 family permease [Treponema sp.]|nr:SLC13 family permease [Treponema sp.]